MEPLQPGLYESLLTEQLRLAIAGMADRAKLDTLDKAEAPALLAQFLQLKIQQTLENEDGDNHLEKRLQIANGPKGVRQLLPLPVTKSHEFSHTQLE